ncbi:MAG: HAMP domain-containing sensor histidine kinase [Candidatus Dactylopiibacterium sp.]|nr:HAMP domain-containing sensor histidine kinase [Candidatus Dactylopiibacterium sp.]
MSWAERFVGLVGSSTFRHAALTAFVFLLMTFGSIWLSSRQIESLMESHVREMVLADVQAHERQARLHDAPALARELARADTRDNDGNVALVLAADGRLLFGERHLQHALAPGAGHAAAWRKVVVAGRDGDSARMFGVQVRLRDGGTFFSAFDILPMLERVRAIPLVAGSGLFAVLLTSLAIGMYSSLRCTRRVDRIRLALRAYAGGEREVTVPANPHGDEFDRLGTDINHVLARISLLMDEMKSVSSHLAHELRTPLTRLHNRLVGAAEHVGEPLRDEILGAVEEAERIQRMFRAVLRIGEIEGGRCAHAFEWFEARDLLRDVADYYQPLAESSGARLTLGEPRGGLVLGDRALLFQALANLVENALKYAGAGARITLLARLREGAPEIGVADDGPGITPGMRAQAIRRFRRLHHGHDGSGLGLALVEAIARLHSGALVLDANPPRGLLALLRLPPAHAGAGAGGLIEALRG